MPRLRDIPLTCPMYDEIEACLTEIKDILGEQVSDLIRSELDLIDSKADEIRNTASDLRDTCTEIADAKDEKYEALELEKDFEIRELNDGIFDLQQEAESHASAIEDLEALAAGESDLLADALKEIQAYKDLNVINLATMTSYQEEINSLTKETNPC